MDFKFTKVLYAFACIPILDAIVLNSCDGSGNVTPNLQNLVIGLCTMYQHVINTPAFCNKGFRNCTEIWEAFSMGFLHKPECNVSYENYFNFINLSDHSVPKDKSLFWENVYPFVMFYSNGGRKYVSLADTLPGYIGNGPVWCSDPNSTTGMLEPGKPCAGWDATPECPMSAQRGFWIAASRNFGLKASGDIVIMLNATLSPIFEDNTYFAVYELPYLREGDVIKATVLLLNENPKVGKTSCNEPSLKNLSMALKKKHIKYDCIENRRDVVAAFCVNNEEAAICSVLQNGATNKASNSFSCEKTCNLVLFASSVIYFKNAK